MNRRFALTLLGCAALSACAPLPSANPLSREMRANLRIANIEVVTAASAFESTRAAAFSGRLSGDLEGLLRTEFADQMSDGGLTMSVEISRLNIASTTATQFGRDQSRIAGAVRLLRADGTLLATYTITQVSGAPSQTTAGALAAAAVTRADRFYRDLLNAFSKDTREQIIGTYLPGERLARSALR